MAPEDRDAAYVWDMLEAAKDVVELMSGKTRQDWRASKMLRMAVERGLEIMGEAAGRVSKPFQDQHCEVPWRNIIGQRNVLAHQYGKIDYDLLYQTATRDVIRLIGILSKLLPPVEHGDS